MRLAKPIRKRDAKYLAWIRTQPCAVNPGGCGGGIEAHHIREDGQGGLGTKPDDSRALPFCTYMHRIYHSIGKRAFEQRMKVDLEAEIKRLNQQYTREVGVKRERPPTLKSPRLYVGFNVRNCPACLGGHTLALSKVNFDREEYACPVKGKTVSYG